MSFLLISALGTERCLPGVEFLLMCLVHNVKKIVKKVLQGTIPLPGSYSKLIEEAMPGYREDKLLLVGVVV